MKIPLTIELAGLGHMTYDLAGEKTRWGDLVVPDEIAVVFPGARNEPRVEMKLGVVGGVPSCLDLRLIAKEGAAGVRSTDLRRVTLENWIEDLFAVASMEVRDEKQDDSGYSASLGLPDVEGAIKAVRTARRGARRKLTDDVLREVAEVYRANAAKAPTQSVADHFGVSHRTAAFYVQRARTAGTLPETTRGKKGI